MKIYKSVDELVGGTPLLELGRLMQEKKCFAKILAKLESFNPAGSIKDRVALRMIEDAEERGVLRPGSVIIEPTSGNTGIGLSAIGAARGYKVIIVMPDTMSEERRALMRAYGAELVLTDGKLGMKGAILEAERLAAVTPGAFLAGQFVNPANPAAHESTTGPEIWKDTEGEVDIFVAGVGTGGTLTGVGEYLKSKKNGIRVVAVEPRHSAVLSGKSAGTHGLQGIGAGFVPEILNTSVYDEIQTVLEEDAKETARMLGRQEGILCGISGGAALWAALQVAKRPENEGKTVVVLLPDSGERYLSTDLYGE